MIRKATASDANSITRIYNYYISETYVTFEEDSIDDTEMARRIAETHMADLPFLVHEDELGRLTGYAYASKWKGRCAYRYSLEVTVYLGHDKVGKGVGTQLYKELFKQLKQLGYHAVLGGITLPNPASVALHEKFGMRKSAHFKEVGFKFETWVDVGYWQGLLNEML